MSTCKLRKEEHPERQRSLSLWAVSVKAEEEVAAVKSAGWAREWGARLKMTGVKTGTLERPTRAHCGDGAGFWSP